MREEFICLALIAHVIYMSEQKQNMGRSRDDDSSSVLTIQLDGKTAGKKSKRSVDSISSDLSEAKLQQLADAREKSIQSRRMTMKSKLERKLEDLNLLMGDLRSDQVERVGQAMIDLETKLRQKQNDFTQELNQHIRGMRDEMRELRKELLRPGPSASVVSSSVASRRV
jgi:hypothetical protein